MVNIEFDFPKQKKEKLGCLLKSIRLMHPTCEIVVERFYNNMNDKIILSCELSLGETTKLQNFVGFELYKICKGE